MSSTSYVNGNTAGGLHPTVSRQPETSEELRKRSVGRSLSPNDISRVTSDISSGASTPIPPDAPPSAHATSSAKRQARAAQRKRLFPTIDYEDRVSHFDPRSKHSDFRGFFVLFWIGLAILVITTCLRNVKETGYPFQFRQRDVFLENIWELALCDLLLVASTALNIPLHMLYASGSPLFRWSICGRWIQCTFQSAFLFFWVNLPFARSWTWTAQVFFTLHLLALFMKVHSYAFYCGHLSETKLRLQKLDNPKEIHSLIKRPAAVRYPSYRDNVHNALEVLELPEQKDAKKPQDELKQLREDLAMELTSPLGSVTYPQNVSMRNYVHFLCCPTLCYELEYPRTEKTDYFELLVKTLAVFGCIFLMTITTEEFIMPVLEEAAVRLQSRSSAMEGGLIFAEAISRLLFPFMVAFLLTFLVIFEYILGAFAEITRFADRNFYDDWWNSSDWLEFSREWNIPVHNFFRRHVYLASRSFLSRPAATTITFFISALAHELVMGCISRKLRGYGAVAMMLQMPIVMVQRSKFVRGRTLLNNVLFWCSMILGLSMMCALYVLA